MNREILMNWGKKTQAEKKTKFSPLFVLIFLHTAERRIKFGIINWHYKFGVNKKNCFIIFFLIFICYHFCALAYNKIKKKIK